MSSGQSGVSPGCRYRAKTSSTKDILRGPASAAGFLFEVCAGEHLRKSIARNRTESAPLRTQMDLVVRFVGAVSLRERTRGFRVSAHDPIRTLVATARRAPYR